LDRTLDYGSKGKGSNPFKSSKGFGKPDPFLYLYVVNKLNTKMQKYKIIEHTIGTCMPIYYVKVTHPWFKNLWTYLGKFTDKYYFTTINDRQTVYLSLEEAYRRVQEHKSYKRRLRDLYKWKCQEEKRICKYL
jgi:hypothetical protein